MLRKIMAIGLLALAATTGEAEARDRWVGEWSGNCGQDVQCWVTISPAGAGYTISWIVADRTDASRVQCRIESTTAKSSQRLIGPNGRPITMTGGGAAIEIVGTGNRWDDLVDCAGRRREVPGTYSAFGD